MCCVLERQAEDDVDAGDALLEGTPDQVNLLLWRRGDMIAGDNRSNVACLKVIVGLLRIADESTCTGQVGRARESQRAIRRHLILCFALWPWQLTIAGLRPLIVVQSRSYGHLDTAVLVDDVCRIRTSAESGGQSEGCRQRGTARVVRVRPLSQGSSRRIAARIADERYQVDRSATRGFRAAGLGTAVPD